MENYMPVLLALALMLAFVPVVSAHGNETFSAAEALISAHMPCANLTQDQLSGIGDYYMEQMHPGAAHEQMDAMMGGDGSPALEAMHIRMAEAFYCSGQDAVDAGNASGSAWGGGYGMMGGWSASDAFYSGGYGMMGGAMGQMMAGSCPMMDGAFAEGGYGRPAGFSSLGFLWFLAGSVLFSLIFWGVYLLLVQHRRRAR